MPPAVAPLLTVGSSILGGLAGGRTDTTKLPPPTSLFPGATDELSKLFGPGGAGDAGVTDLEGFAKNGMPTDVADMYNTLVAASQKQRAEGQANIEEQFGSTGLRYSKPLMSSLVDYNNQENLNLSNTLANYLFQTQESAANRQLQAGSLLLNTFTQLGTTFTPSAALTPGGQGLNAAAGGLGSLGSLLLSNPNIFKSSSGGAAPLTTLPISSINIPNTIGPVYS